MAAAEAAAWADTALAGGDEGERASLRALGRSGSAADAAEARPADQHIVHTLAVPSSAAFTKIKLDVVRPAARWGVSVWKLSVYGVCD